MRIADTALGFLEFDGNELTIGSKVDDPPKLRLASPSGALGAISGSRLRPDGQQNEKVLLILKDEAGGGTYDFFGQQAGTVDDAGMKRLKTLDTLKESFLVPVEGLPTPSQSRFYSANGRYCWNCQDDGHQVQYDTHNSTNEASWTAVWSNWLGLLKPLPWV